MEMHKPGDVEILKIELSNTNDSVKLNLTELFIELDLYEDINKNHMTGYLLISDSLDLINKVPIIGEETLEISFKSPFVKDVITKTFYVYAIETRSTDKSKSVYNLNLISLNAIKNENLKFSKSMSGFTHEIVKTVLGNQHLDIDESYESIIETSTNKIKYISNYWTPFKNISYCASKSTATNKNNNPGFLFFETNKRYKFVSVNTLFDKTINLNTAIPKVYSFDANTGRTEIGNNLGTQYNFEGQLTNIISIKTNRQFNYLRNLMVGSYANRVIEFDILRKTLVNKNYNYWYNFEEDNHAGDHPIHTKYVQFNDTDLNVSCTPVFTHTNEDVYTDNTATIESKRLPILSQLDFISFNVEIWGRSDLEVGDLIWMNIKSPEAIFDEGSIEGNNKDYYDKFLSGRYLISSVQHRISSAQHKMVLKVTKDSLENKIKI